MILINTHRCPPELSDEFGRVTFRIDWASLASLGFHPYDLTGYEPFVPPNPALEKVTDGRHK